VAVEIRPCRDAEELAAYNRVVNYVFANNDEGGLEAGAQTLPEWTTCAFLDGKLACTLGTLPFTVRLNGAPVPMGGVTQVGTLPEFRRQGLLRKVMRDALGSMRENNQPFAILWASMAAIYQRFGYGLASERVFYRFDPRFAAFQRDEPIAGSVTMEPTEDAFPTIKQIYIEAATPRNLHIHRSRPLWQIDVLKPPAKGAKVYTAIYRDAAGSPRGYVVYSTHEDHRPEPGPNHVLTVSDFVWLDLPAFRALWEYLRRHDLAGTIEMKDVAPDDPAPDLLLEPRMLNRRTSDAIWMRVVDVERGLGRRPYGDSGQLCFAIDGDDMCAWNNDTFLLETDGKESDICRADREPQLVMRPNALASLVSGYRSASRLAAAGLMDVREPRALRTADALFRTEHAPYCPNDF
jgi:predicted acetyltransferase